MKKWKVTQPLMIEFPVASEPLAMMDLKKLLLHNKHTEQIC